LPVPEAPLSWVLAVEALTCRARRRAATSAAAA